MLRQIKNTTNLSYPIGDTFAMTVEANSGGFPEGTVLELVIAKSADNEPLIDSTYNLSDGTFYVKLSDGQKSKLTIGNYIYKFILKGIDGTVFTQLSGNLYVTWEA